MTQNLSVPRAQNAPPAMTDVARAAGVHHTTVSRALRNDVRISEAVRERIRKVADDLGYRPNPLLSTLGALRRQRASTTYFTPLACISYRFRFSPEHLQGIVQTARQRGFNAEVFIIDDDLSAERLNAILIARNIRGIILAPLREAHGRFQLEWERFCTVAIEYSFDAPAFDRVVTDSSGAMNIAIGQCRRRGMSALGVCLAQVVDERNEGLIRAAYALARERFSDIKNLPPLILPEWNEEEFLAWLRKHNPEVIISSNTLLPGIRLALQKLKKGVPRDIGLINLNLLDPSDTMAGISQDSPAMGAVAARMLIDKIYHNEMGIPSSRITVLTESRWKDGKTLSNLKKPRKA
jgi:DNA-binding LacI/PurR family transcriptional regulator